jgi:hypothetical protein
LTLGRRILGIVAFAILGLAGLYTFSEIFAFSKTRFFTVDEYQYGHATWLVAQGKLPYVDFFEHHFPLSYVLHAPLYWAERDFETSALLLRKIVFSSWLALSILTAWSCWAITRDRWVALLAGFMPMSFGFSLMSAIDYRADNFAAIYFAACLVLLEWNRSANKRGVAILCGLLATTAALMTQKMAFVAGCTVSAMLVFDLIARFARQRSSRWAGRAPFIAQPAALIVTATLLGVALLATAGALGMIPNGFEATILQAIEHERYYAPFSLFEKGYVWPFWEQTWTSSLPIAVFAAGFLATRAGRFWLFPALVSGLGSFLVVAPYPYNFVFLCWIGVLAAVRGFGLAVGAVCRWFPALEEASPLLYLLPLAALGPQVGFVVDTVSNEHQLEVLRKIERYGTPEDAVIDGAGGAMFSPDASYYFYHGDAHRKMFADYFEHQLVDDYRKSRALFWIWDMRFRNLPKPARDYLQQHYIHGGEGLYVLGTRTPATGDEPQVVRFELIRGGEYQFHKGRSAGSERQGSATGPLLVDGKPLSSSRMQLDAGVHELRIPPGSPAYRITPVDASFFDHKPAPPRYTMMFEYWDPEEQKSRTVFDLIEDFPVAAEMQLAQVRDGAIVQRPGSVLRYQLVLPEAPRLRGHARLRGELDPVPANNGRVVIEIRSAGLHDTLVSELESEPLRHPGRTIDANLARYAGRTVELSVRFEGAPSDRRVIWSRLAIDEVTNERRGGEPPVTSQE